MVVTNKINSSITELKIDYEKLIGKPWTDLLDDFLESEYMQNLQLYMDETYKANNFVFPTTLEKCFKPFRMVSPKRTQVVIFADEPYKNIKANGLAFGFDKAMSTDILPFQLSEIIKILDKDEKTFDTTLTDWALQGVLLLNTSLFVEVNGQTDTQVIFRNFIREIIKKLEESTTEIVFVFTSQNQFDVFSKYINDEFHEILLYPKGIEKSPTLFDDVNNILKESFGEIGKIIW